MSTLCRQIAVNILAYALMASKIHPNISYLSYHMRAKLAIATAIYLGCPRASDVAPSDLYCGDGSAPPLVRPSKGNIWVEYNIYVIK